MLHFQSSYFERNHWCYFEILGVLYSSPSLFRVARKPPLSHWPEWNAEEAVELHSPQCSSASCTAQHGRQWLHGLFKLTQELCTSCFWASVTACDRQLAYLIEKECWEGTFLPLWEVLPTALLSADRARHEEARCNREFRMVKTSLLSSDLPCEEGRLRSAHPAEELWVDRVMLSFRQLSRCLSLQCKSAAKEV